MNSNASILIIDDEPDIRLSLRGIFEDEGWQVREAASGNEGVLVALDTDVDLIFLDIWMPGMDGMQVLRTLREHGLETPIVMISGHGTVETAVAALKDGAFDFIEKPLSLENTLVTAEKALEVSRLKRENRELRQRVRSEKPSIIGSSLGIARVRELVAQVAPTEAWVLIVGENGTGKEITAQSIHLASRRSGREMICVNCAAIPEELIESELFGHEKGAFTGADKARKGKFELADKSTLFLDEIADMSLKTQAKILRILQERTFERVGGTRTFQVDVRVIAATNKDLEQEIRSGRFRADLYYRLNVFPLRVPPLRERASDLPEMIAWFSQRLIRTQNLKSVTFTHEALDMLGRYAWPGNVRELKNFVERLFILYQGLEVTAAMLPPEYREKALADTTDMVLETSDFKEAKGIFEEAFLRRELARAGGNITRLAENIGLDRTYLYRKLKMYGIRGEDGRPHDGTGRR